MQTIGALFVIIDIMKSPFPGMDPYLEPHWWDVHTSLISEARRHLNRLLPPGLIARVEERVAIEADDDFERRIGLDARVFSPSTADPSEGRGGIAIEAPFKLVVEYDPIIERFIRIIDQGGELITVIEVLSPTNKAAPGLEQYRQKRRQLLSAGVHVVEVDLVRAGDWRAVMLPELCPAKGVSTYTAIVGTAGERPAGYLYPIALRQPLPETPIPLRPKDTPVRLSLQTLLEAAYEDGGYDQTLDYRQPLFPPLAAEGEAWMEGLLQSAGKR